VPSADAAVCGDVIYNNVHMMMYEADAAKREAWIASVDAIAALNPKIVVAGHKSVGAADRPENLAASQQYLRDFTTLAKKGGTVEDLVHGMLALHGERDQPHTLWISARAEVARRTRTAAIEQLPRQPRRQERRREFDMQAAIEQCEKCHDVCMRTVTHCLDQGNSLGETDHIRALLDCIDFCATCVSFMLRDSPAHRRVCEICAEVCDACAVSCERFADDEVVTECAKECRRCAESCRKMAGTKGHASSAV